MIRSEYLRFLQTLTSGDISVDVRKVANLVLNHLDTLFPLSTAQGQRIKKIAKLAQTNWATTTADIQPEQQQTATQTCPFTQLKSLSVGPFRGFARHEEFDLAREKMCLFLPMRPCIVFVL